MILFFRSILGIAIALGSTEVCASGEVQDILGLDDKNKSHSLTYFKATSEDRNQEENNHPATFSLPDEVLMYLFNFLDAKDLGRVFQVSKQWQRVAVKPTLWRSIGLRKYREYLTEEDLQENPKQTVTWHYLCTMINAMEDLKTIERLVQYYGVYSYAPSFKRYIGTDLSLEIDDLANREELIAQGNIKAIERKILGAGRGGDSYISDYYIDYTCSGYYHSANHVREQNAKYCFVYRYEQHPDYGYEKNLAVAMQLNEVLVERGNLEAIKRKIEGLKEGIYGYPKNPQATILLRETLVVKNDSKNINLLGKGLVEDPLEDDKNPSATKEQNEVLVKSGDSKAIKRKMEGLEHGRYGYKKSYVVLRTFIEILVEKGNLHAIKKKVKGIKYGLYGYTRNLNLLRELNEILVEEGNLEAIKWKIEDSIKDSKTMQSFIENKLIIGHKPFARGIGHYLKVLGLKYGIFDYERNRTQAIEYIKRYNVPF